MFGEIADQTTGSCFKDDDRHVDKIQEVFQYNESVTHRCLIH